MDKTTYKLIKLLIQKGIITKEELKNKTINSSDIEADMDLK